ncbi:MAG: translation initiation factor [Alishewanella sp.]|nr:translation initiation factor [Alishewanella sp.]
MSKKISLADWQQQLTGATPESTNPANQAGLVYSTATGRIDASSPAVSAAEGFADGALRIRRETKGRGGKTVLTILGLTVSPSELSQLCTELKKKCACGGSVKDGIIEIQGDKRELVTTLLQQKGFKVKQAGG